MVVQKPYDWIELDSKLRASSGDTTTFKEIVSKVEALLEEDTFDWRTPTGLSHDLGIPQAVIKKALVSLGDKVRNPLYAEGEELTNYRLTSKKLTRGEKWRKVRSLILQEIH